MIKCEYSSIDNQLTTRVDLFNFLSGRDKVALLYGLLDHMGIADELYKLSSKDEINAAIQRRADVFWDAK